MCERLAWGGKEKMNDVEAGVGEGSDNPFVHYRLRAHSNK